MLKPTPLIAIVAVLAVALFAVNSLRGPAVHLLAIAGPVEVAGASSAPSVSPPAVAAAGAHAAAPRAGRSFPFKLIAARDMPLVGSRLRGPVFRPGNRLRTSSHTSTGSPAPSGPSTSSGLKTSLYNSLDKPGIAAADNTTLGNGSPPTPPDSTGAIGPNDYVEISNSVIHVWDRSLTSVSSASLSTFIGTANPYCDPQVQWDPAAGRWLFAFLLCNTSSSSATFQAFLVGWSTTSDPSNLSTTGGTPGWCGYGVRTEPDLLDYIKLGHNANYLIVGGNFYDMTNPSAAPFVSAAIAWLTLPANGVTICPAPSALTLNGTSISTPLKNADGVTNAFTPVPVNTDTSAPNGYIVSASDPSGSNGQAPGARSKLAVWHLNSTGTLIQDPDIAVASYDMPPLAPELGSSVPLDTLDGRLTQAVGDPVTGIWTQHTVDNVSVSPAVAKVTWYELALSGSALAVVQSGDITHGTDSIFNAAISPSMSARGAAIEYSRSSPTMDPVIEYQVRAGGTPAGQMEPGVGSIATGVADVDASCGFQGFPCRWGDYSAFSPDPNPAAPYAVWGTNEVSGAATSTPAWQNYNFAVYAAVVPHAPTGVTAAANGPSSAMVSWTNSTFDAGAPDTAYQVNWYSGGTVVGSSIFPVLTTSWQVNGLAAGCYTFTVAAFNVLGHGAESSPSNAVSYGRGTCTGTAASPAPRGPAHQAPAQLPPSPSPRP